MFTTFPTEKISLVISNGQSWDWMNYIFSLWHSGLCFSAEGLQMSSRITCLALTQSTTLMLL